MLDEKNNKIYSRKGINELATAFYKDLYKQTNLEISELGESKGRETFQRKEREEIQEIMYEEVEAIVDESKAGKSELSLIHI